MEKTKKVGLFRLCAGVLLSVIFILTAIAFFFEQFVFVSSIYMVTFSGPVIAFGLTIEGGRAGFFPFCLPFFFSIIGIICAAFAVFKKPRDTLKRDTHKALFGICVILTLTSSAVYVLTYFYDQSNTEIGHGLLHSGAPSFCIAQLL